jgi:superfamily II DNA or RNA helicase
MEIRNSREYETVFLEPGVIIEGAFWPERVQIISVKRVGSNIWLEGKGLTSNKLYSTILKENELVKVKKVLITKRNFSGDADAFFLFLEGKRIRFAFQFDPLYAVNVSQIDPLPHQIDAVYHYILRRPRIRFLLADDPGAGKTIMAGLVLKELKLRGLVNRVLIVIPGHLRDQWLREMKEKFNETFRVIDRAVMNASYGRNVWLEENQAITSMDFAKQEDVMLGLAEAHWDLVIVDEAHKMAAYEYGGKLSRTERYKLGELLSRNSNFMLFLTATPHKGDPKNFRLFLNLLEPDLFANEEILAESFKNKENPLFLRRLKEDLKDFDGRPLFTPRKVITITYRLSDDEKKLYNAVTEYVEKHYNKAMQKEKRNVAFALLILQRRLASSIRAIRRSLERRKERLLELYNQGKILYELERGYVDEETLEDLPEFERWQKENELLEKLSSAETLDELKEEIDTLEELIKLAKQAEKMEVETKLIQLKKVIDDEKIREKGEKLLIFTESRDTLEYLVDKISSWGYSVNYIHGSMSLDERIRAEHVFRENTQIMVSTEAGGEGINLQFCSLMVNYDIPWNPNRLEQRMGRIHRYGQQYETHIYNLVAKDTREGKILETLFRKLETIKECLGSDKVFDVIGEVLAGVNLQQLIIDAITNRRSMEEILREIERIPDEEAIKRAKEAALEGLATKHIDFSRILGEQRIAKENRLVPEYIEKFFLKASEKLGLRVEKRKDGYWRISNIPYDLRALGYDFKIKYGEVFREYNKFSFDKEHAYKGQAEFVAPGHPLLEAVVEKIFQIYREEVEKGAIFLDPSASLNGFIWFLEGVVNDGTGAVAGKRIYALYQDAQNRIRQVSPSILWDLKPCTDKNILSELKNTPDEESVINYAIETILPQYLDELKAQREHYAEIKKKYGLASLDELIAQSVSKLTEYETRRAKGEAIPDVVIQNERRNREELEKRKEKLLKSIEAETHLSLSTPKILGVVAVLPKIPTDDTLKEDREIEEIGMRIAMEFEISQGRRPVDISAQNLGFDIRSESPDGTFRYIEVKTRARDGKIALTPNEWLMAHRLGSEYWLYVIINAVKNPELYTIQDPATKLHPEEEVEVVRYVVSDWKNVANREKIKEG